MVGLLVVPELATLKDKLRGALDQEGLLPFVVDEAAHALSLGTEGVLQEGRVLFSELFVVVSTFLEQFENSDLGGGTLDFRPQQGSTVDAAPH